MLFGTLRYGFQMAPWWEIVTYYLPNFCPIQGSPARMVEFFMPWVRKIAQFVKNAPSKSSWDGKLKMAFRHITYQLSFSKRSRTSQICSDLLNLDCSNSVITRTDSHSRRNLFIHPRAKYAIENKNRWPLVCTAAVSPSLVKLDLVCIE